MIVLKEELNEMNFERVLAVIWESSAQSLHDTIMLSIDVRSSVENWLVHLIITRKGYFH